MSKQRTIAQIQQAFAESTAAVLGPYYQQIDALKAQRDPAEGRYLDQLDPQQRMSALRGEKHERAGELTEEARREYAEALEQYHSDLAKRQSILEERLFKVEDTAALSQASMATEEQLEQMISLAARTQNVELGRAAFAAAVERGLGQVQHRYLTEIDPEASELYQEYADMPPGEVLDRQSENIETVLPIPDADSLMPRARADLVR